MRGELREKRPWTRGASFTNYLSVDGDAAAVSAGLQHLCALPMLAGLDDDSRSSVEIVLAEALNNIAEHAYARDPGKIDLWITSHETFLFFRLVDAGLPMPGGEAPDGRLGGAPVPRDLPEGGFGWFLIRSLTRDLTYLREGDYNMLSFCVDVNYRH